MSQAPCCKDSAKCLRVREIKANRYIGSSSRSVKLCQWRKGKTTRGCFLFAPQLVDEICEDLIAHQLEACRDSLFVLLTLDFFSVVLRAARLPTQVARIHTTGKSGEYNGEALGHTHTHTNHRSTPQSTRDPNLVQPLQEPSPSGIYGNRDLKKSRKVDFGKKK